MRTALLSLLIVFGLSAAHAQEMPNSLSMSCAAASSLVREKGQVVIASGPNVYQQIVAESGACFADHVAVPAWVPTADQSQCLVGYHCQERVGNDK